MKPGPFLVLIILAASLGSLRAQTSAAPAAGPAPALVAEVRAAMAANDFPAAERLVAARRAAAGVTPEMLLGLSWLGRGHLAAGRLDEAEKYARETHALALEELKKRPMDQEPDLPTAFGASIEVIGQVTASRGARSEAVNYLERQLRTYAATSINKRLQKNINLLSLEGTPAPELDLSETWDFSRGGNPSARIASFKGKVVLLFFWAHWCADCKAQGPILDALRRKYADQGLVVIAPTQRFGYVAGGVKAAPAEEDSHIRQVMGSSYPWIANPAVLLPVSEENHKRYGVSTTPTLVLVDREGLVRLYKPGRLTEAELEAAIRRLL